MSMQARTQRTYRSSLCAAVVLTLAAVAFAASAIRAAAVSEPSQPVLAAQVANFLGHPPADAIAALGAHAKFVDNNFAPITAASATGVIVWQSPLPGQATAATQDVQFLAANEVPVPGLEGMRVSDAKTLLFFRGLELEVVPDCDAKGHSANEDEMNWQVTHQCIAPNDVLTVGGHVGVVIQSWPSGVSNLVVLTLAALAALAAAAALIFFMRMRFAQDELRIYKSGRRPNP